jgi:3D (Asp-Asp-Asp) domain-containing protein
MKIKLIDLKKIIMSWTMTTFIFNTLFFPAPILAQEETKKNLDVFLPKIEKEESPQFINRLPENPNKLYKVVYSRIMPVTAYNIGDVNQCSGDPCISANGENICMALDMGYKRCAANFVPLGTRLNIEGFGQCVVTDRMNSRYHHRVDIAMKKDEYKQAKEFGLKRLKIEVLK